MFSAVSSAINHGLARPWVVGLFTAAILVQLPLLFYSSEGWMAFAAAGSLTCDLLNAYAILTMTNAEQRSQLATQLKLDAILHAHGLSSSIGLEDRGESELRGIKRTMKASL